MRGQRASLTIIFVLCSALLANALKASEVDSVEFNEQTQRYEFMHGNTVWAVVDDEKYGRPYFFNSSVSQWNDPRTLVAQAHTPPVTEVLTSVKQPTPIGTVLSVSVIPVVLLIGALAGRIYYLQTYYPELLWPTKERKKRFKNHMHSKPTKARGKMSQDGKGGRSANS